MKPLSRRDILKTSLLVPAAAAVHGIGPLGSAIDAAAEVPAPPPARSAREASSQNAGPGPGAGRDRLLLDFGWRFHFGNADDPTKDFGFGSGRTGNFQKTGNFLPAGAIAFDDSDWRSVDLPHDWAIELPFTERPRAVRARDSTRWAEPIRQPASAGIAVSSTFRPRTQANASRSSSMVPTAKRWWSSTAFTSAPIAVDTIPSVST